MQTQKEQKDLLFSLDGHYGWHIRNLTGIGLEPRERTPEQNAVLKELQSFFPDKAFSAENLTVDILKVWLLLLDEDRYNNIPKILTYLSATKFGWKKNKYEFSNPCLNCRKDSLGLEKTQNFYETKDRFKVIREIFFDPEYGFITSLLTCYCIAGLFRSKINRSSSPLYLQIACDKNTLLHELIGEIVTICDINTGIYNQCKSDGIKRSCSYNRHEIIYPADVDRSVENLSTFIDTPVIVEGYENPHKYRALLREVSNSSSLRKHLYADSVLPIFLCSEITTNFINFFDVDLNGIEVSEDYLNLIKGNKPALTSIIFNLVRGGIEGIIPLTDDEEEHQKRLNSKHPLSEGIQESIEYMRGKFKTTPKYIQNLGSLRYFFMMFMQEFESTFEGGEVFVRAKIGDAIREHERLLISIHNKFTQAPIDTIDVVIEHEATLDEKRRLKKKAQKHAIELRNCYQSCAGISLIMLGIRVKKERFLYDVKVPKGVSRDKIYRYADDVRVAMEVEYLRPDKGSLSNTIVISEKMLKDNSLEKVMESSAFRESDCEIPIAVGTDVMGESFVVDAVKIIHALVGGCTGSGKSTMLTCILMSLIRQSIDKVNLLIFDFGITHLRQFRNVPHLSHPIIDDMDKGFDVIMELREEQERRRKIYNENPDDMTEFNKLPYIFAIIDEAHQFLQYGDKRRRRDLQEALTDLLARGRGLRIRIYLACQDPTEKNLNVGVTNLSTSFGFLVSREHNSRVMIGESGCEKLSGKGDMLFKSECCIGIKNIQGAYMDEKDIADRIAGMNFTGTGDYKFVIDEPKPTANSEKSFNVCDSPYDKEFEANLAEIILLLFKEKKIANSAIKKLLNVGYDIANTYIDQLVELDLIAPPNGKPIPHKLNPDTELYLRKDMVEILIRSNKYEEFKVILGVEGEIYSTASENYYRGI